MARRSVKRPAVRVRWEFSDTPYYAVIGGWIVKPDYVIGEMERNGEHFRRRGVYTVMIRCIAPVMMFVLFLQSTGILS